MRKFLIDMETEITLDELKDFFENIAEDADGMTFAQYLAACLDKNGSLTEILTEDTPRGEQNRAVTLIRVWYNEEDYADEWLTERQAHDKAEFGYGGTPLYP